VYGSVGCGRCFTVKRILENRGVEFSYIMLSDLTKDQLNDLLSRAEAQGVSSAPIIEKDGQIVKLEEI
jgi:glutaredoxin